LKKNIKNIRSSLKSPKIGENIFDKVFLNDFNFLNFMKKNIRRGIKSPKIKENIFDKVFNI